MDVSPTCTGVMSSSSDKVGGNLSSSSAFVHSSRAAAVLPGLPEQTAPSYSAQSPGPLWGAWLGNHVPHRGSSLTSEAEILFLVKPMHVTNSLLEKIFLEGGS